MGAVSTKSAYSYRLGSVSARNVAAYCPLQSAHEHPSLFLFLALSYTARVENGLPTVRVEQGRPIAARPSSRVPGLDAARVLATLGVVWVHTSEIQDQSAALATLGRFGTSFYVFGAVFLAARVHFRDPGARTRDVAARRAKRLLVPYVLWCAIYAVFYYATMRPQGHPVEVITRYWGPLYGTAPHLWFLPFAFVAGVLASYLTPRLMKLDGPLLVAIGCIVTLGLYVSVYGWGYSALDKAWITRVRIHRLARWTEELPMVVGAIFGCAVYGKYLDRISRWGRRKRHRVAAFCMAGFVLTQLAYAVFLEDLGQLFWNRVRFLSNVAGGFWFAAFIALRKSRWIERIAPLGRATYFAYLCHQLILDAVKVPLSRFEVHGSLWFAIFSTLAIYLASVGIGLFVARVRFLRWLSP